MRFGRSFHKHQLHEWTYHYVDYHTLKKHAKALSNQRRENNAVREILEIEFAKAGNFYLAQYGRLHARVAQYSQDGYSSHALDSFRAKGEIPSTGFPLEENFGTLLELLEHLERLWWFGYVNYVASQRILNKFYRFTASRQASIELGSLLIQRPFAQQDRCLSDIREIESAINNLAGIRVRDPIESSVSGMSEPLHGLSQSKEEALHVLARNFARRQKVSELVHKSYQRLDFGIALPALDDTPVDKLGTPDDSGRNPLHYAAEAGLLELCRFFLEARAKEDLGYAASILLAEDTEGNTPTHLSINYGHVRVTEYLLEALRNHREVRHPISKRLQEMLGSLLHLAARVNLTGIGQVLINGGADINHRGIYGETVLHLAARNGNIELIRSLQNVAAFRGLVNVQDSTYGHTALVLACIEGVESVVELLVWAGAAPDVIDARGWTAKEHAAFQGHLRLVKYLGVTPSFARTIIEPAPDQAGNQQAVHLELSRPARRRDGPDPTPGQIHVRLGASNTRSNWKTVDLKLPRWLTDDQVRHRAGYALEISLSHTSRFHHIIHLPLLEDLTNYPLIFDTTDPRGAQLVFRLVRLQSYTGGSPEVIGSGVAILRTLQERLASKHESLVRDQTIPILAKDTLAVIGGITFSFLIVTSLTHPEVPLIAAHGFWKQHGRTKVIGHRGSGANNTTKTSLQIGENTIQSFTSAVTSGASCIEFDVQLTKDLIPVIFHDFLVMETGGDVPLHTLTRDQFMHLSKLQSSQGSRLTQGDRGRWDHCRDLGAKEWRPRSLSEDRYGPTGDVETSRRMRYTEEGIRNDIKGNLRGFSIQEPSTTLEELFTKVPESVAFNLEMKYPMLWEAEDRDMDFFAIELNLFVDTILQMVYRLGGKRSITFSSFSPDVCIMLSTKQQVYPVLFINKAGSVPTGDFRASNLQQAIQFAKAWRLAGIVMLSDVFVLCPQLLHYAKSSGLICGSYGDLNDDPACAKIQAEAGLDAIIVNKVRLITQELAKPSA
ncbi:MAG: hypothetical protein LQ338_000528 [Usnochroma carphineum]|nr:MAG: hypothetical protein LQ338_000528 [Usnochroma carphineum]